MTVFHPHRGSKCVNKQLSNSPAGVIFEHAAYGQRWTSVPFEVWVHPSPAPWVLGLIAACEH